MPLCNQFPLIVQMRRDLFAAYRDVTSKPCPTQRQAWMRTVKHPAPRFYVTSGRACCAISSMMTYGFDAISNLSETRQRMYRELYNIVMELSQKREYQGQSLIFIVSKALTMPASEFYIGWESFKKTFRNAKRYGIDFTYPDAISKNKAYTNCKDNKPKDAKYNGKKIHIIK